MLEIVTPEWQYVPGKRGDFDTVVQVKERRRLGTPKKGDASAQAPAIEVRLHKRFLPKKCHQVFAKAEVWCYGPSSEEKKSIQYKAPQLKGSPLRELRAGAPIKCEENLAEFLDSQENDHVYAKLRCILTRGARVFCRQNHVALCIRVCSRTNGRLEAVKTIQRARTARVSISEKSMRPNNLAQSGDKRKATSIMKRTLDTGRGCRKQKVVTKEKVTSCEALSVHKEIVTLGTRSRIPFQHPHFFLQNASYTPQHLLNGQYFMHAPYSTIELFHVLQLSQILRSGRVSKV